LLLYLWGTQNYALEFNGNTEKPRKLFLAASDSSFADDSLSRASSHGNVFMLFDGVIDYHSIKGKTVTTSSTEAELLALSFAARYHLYWLRFFEQIGLDIEEKATLYCDNRNTLRLLQQDTPKLQTALKHVDVHQCWLRQEVQSGNISVEWVATAEMVADGFTKMLPAQKHKEFLRQLNLVDISEKILETAAATKAG